jgi:O-antigen ligase
MAIQTGMRSRLSRVASTAAGETRLAMRAAPNVLRHLAPIVAWAIVAVGLGVVLGLSAVILPPMGAFAIVGAAGLVLLWVMPDLPLVSPRLIRKTFFVMLVTDLCIPYYYTVQFSGLPWISARRLATFCLIVPFLVAVAASSGVRRNIMERVRASSPIFICALGFLIMVVLSVFTSMIPTESASGLVDLILSAYVPFFAMLYIAKDNDDIVFILKIICVCALFNTAGGVLNFILHRNFFLEIIPPSLLDALITNNPSLAALLPSPGHFRHGLYRAESIFVTPLSFGEFEIIAIPIGLFFAIHRTNMYEKLLGWAVVFGGVIGIFCSGSRGGWLGAITALPIFIAIWSMRKLNTSKASLAPAISGLIGVLFFGAIIGAVNLSHSFHDMILGGAAEANSTQARYDQWASAIPYIKSNPITGHGFNMGGSIFQDYTIDSYILSLVLETGVPGLLFFMGIVLLPVWYGLRSYLDDMTEYGALAGALACSFIAFAENRLVLAQKENHMLIFSLLAIVIVANYERARKRLPQPIGDKSLQDINRPPGSFAPGGPPWSKSSAPREYKRARTGQSQPVRR